MTEETAHFCPGCGRPQPLFARYPWYFCGACLAMAESGSGRRLRFGNASPCGGLVWRHDDEPEQWRPAVRVACLILGRPVLVCEARFGGVVAQPVCEAFHHEKPELALDLTRPETEGGR